MATSVCLFKRNLYESHVIFFRIYHTRNRNRHVSSVFFFLFYTLFSFTHYSNLTFLFFSSTVYRSYNRNSEKKTLAFRFSAWARHVSVTSHRKEKTKYTATDMTSKWRRKRRRRGGESIESETRSLDAIGSCEPTTLDSLFHSLSLCPSLTSMYRLFFLFYLFCCLATVMFIVFRRN